jgi:serine/threonine-protein kinase
MASTSSRESPGTVVGDKYRIVALLGEGGMACVYEAVHVGLGTPVAVKILDGRYAKQSEFLERFSREAQAAASIESPHVAKVMDVGRMQDGRPFLAMELLVGGHLRALVDERGPLPVEMATDFVEQAARGLATAHAMGIIHRDIKPENLVACELGAFAGDRHLVKVLDFGIAKDIRQQASRMTAAGETMGSVMYMSPEQIRSAANVDARTDVWALGIVLYELLSGNPPFLGDQQAVLAQVLTEPHTPIRAHRPDVPELLEQILDRALAKNPAERFQSAAELADALLVFTPQESVRGLVARLPPESIPKMRVRPPPPASSASRLAPTVGAWTATSPRRSGPSGKVIGLSFALVAAAGLVIVFMSFPSKPKPAPAMAATTVPVTPVVAPPIPVAEPPPVVSVDEPAPAPAPVASASAARPRKVRSAPAPTAAALPRRF